MVGGLERQKSDIIFPFGAKSNHSSDHNTNNFLLCLHAARSYGRRRGKYLLNVLLAKLWIMGVGEESAFQFMM